MLDHGALKQQEGMPTSQMGQLFPGTLRGLHRHLQGCPQHIRGDLVSWPMQSAAGLIQLVQRCSEALRGFTTES